MERRVFFTVGFISFRGMSHHRRNHRRHVKLLVSAHTTERCSLVESDRVVCTSCNCEEVAESKIVSYVKDIN